MKKALSLVLALVLLSSVGLPLALAEDNTIDLTSLYDYDDHEDDEYVDGYDNYGSYVDPYVDPGSSGGYYDPGPQSNS